MQALSMHAGGCMPQDLAPTADLPSRSDRDRTIMLLPAPC